MLDKYYTKPEIAKECLDRITKEYTTWIEPSAGNGSFSKLKPGCIAMDIEPEDPSIFKQDFLKYKFIKENSCIVFGNPPFGKNSSMAKKFFNHAASFSDSIAFILPRTFRKVSITNVLNLKFHLVYEWILPRNSFTEEGRDKNVPCVFQIWERKAKLREKVRLPVSHQDFIFTTKDKADFSLRRVGGKAGTPDRNLNWAESSNYFISSKIEDMFDRFLEIEPKLKEVSLDTAGNPSIGKGEIVKVYSSVY